MRQVIFLYICKEVKTVLFKISAFFFSLLLICSTLSYAIDKHDCGNTLVDTSFYTKAASCGMEKTKTTTNGCTYTKKSCCSDKQILIQGQDEVQQASLNGLYAMEYVAPPFLNVSSQPITLVEKQRISHPKYIPPLVVKILYQLDESYLI